MKNLLVSLFAITLLCSLSYTAVAADKEPIRERWAVSAGGFFIRNADTTIQLNALDGRIGTTIDFGDDLGLESGNNTFKLDGYWRINNHHALRADYYKINRSGQRNIDIDIHFGDEFFAINTDVVSNFDSQIFDVLYQYSFYNTDKVELGVQGGFHISTLDVGIRLADAPGGGLEESAGVTAPLPVFGFYARYNFLPKLAVIYEWKTLELEIGDFGGSFRDTSIVVEHRSSKFIGFGFGLQRFDFSLDASKDDFSGEFNTNWDGIYVYMLGYTL